MPGAQRPGQRAQPREPEQQQARRGKEPSLKRPRDGQHPSWLHSARRCRALPPIWGSLHAKLPQPDLTPMREHEDSNPDLGSKGLTTVLTFLLKG